MADLYPNYAALAAARQIGVDYRLLTRIPPGSRLAHIAIHGGGIEPGTTEIADYLAGSTHRFYCFDGMLPSGNSDLHITSTAFDEPQALSLVAASDYVMSWHGAAGTVPVTYIGGLDTEVGGRITEALTRAGFSVEPGGPGLTGTDPLNIVNKGARSMGVQMELTTALRESFFEDFTRLGRDGGARTADFFTYMAAVQSALSGLDVPATPAAATSRGRVARPAAGAPTASGDFGIPALSPLTVDGMALGAVREALRLNTLARQASGSTERFWSSPPRANGDPVREVLEISLSTGRAVNRVSFSLARFPQRVWLQWRDRDGLWHPAHQAGTRSPVLISIMDSLPDIIPAGVASDLRLHPQHFGAGHWMAQLVDIEPVKATRFRLVMARLPSSAAPRGTDGQPVPYSLGVRDATVSYRAASLKDLPWLPQASAEHSVAFAASQDILGSQLDFVLRRNRAASVITGDGTWRCMPQPVPDAVVSLYLDLRTSSGQPQVVDRLRLDPLVSGPSLNLYCSDEVPAFERFTPSANPLGFPLARPSTVLPVADESGVLFGDESAYLDVDNRGIQFDPAEPFLLSMLLQPQFTSEDEASYTFLDNGVLRISAAAGELVVQLGERQVEVEAAFSFNQTVALAVAYDGSTLTVRTPSQTRIQESVEVPKRPSPAILRLGGRLDGGAGLVRVTSLFLARGRTADIIGIDTHWNDPTAYSLPPGYEVDQREHTSANAILRMDPSLVTEGAASVCPWGLIGGPGDQHSDLSWTPIPGDFTVAKAVLKFRPVKARFLKLEFTNLQPIPITPSQAQPLVTVSLFPSGSGQGSSVVAQSRETQSGAAPSGAQVATEQGAVFQYLDANRISTADRWQSSSYLPTEALYAPDPLDAQRIRRAGSNLPFLPLPDTRRQRFTSTGQHRYQTMQMALDTKTAYTVALRQVQALYADPVAERDTEQYVDLFLDTTLLSGYSDGAADGWTHTGEAMVTVNPPSTQGAAMMSTTFVSKRRVLGVQFAAQASDPKQLLTDPDFEDESLHFWRPVGDATIEASTQFSTTIGKMAQVTRGHARSSWGALEASYPTWEAIEASNPLSNRPVWWEVENDTSKATFGGIESLRGVTPAPAGRLYAAARVYVGRGLAQPLRLQLVNGDGRILAESSQPIESAQIAEWYVGTTIRSAPPDAVPEWSELGEGTETWAEMEAVGTWGDIGMDYEADHVFDVRARVIQEGDAGTGAWLMDALAIYNDPIIWEISRDGGLNWYEMVGIRNNPRGAFTFPELPPSDRTGGTQMRWRCRGFSQDLAVSSVVLRPWYATMSGAVPYYDTLQAAGQATSLADYYPPVELDPLFQGWALPIPQDWWLASKQWQHQTNPRTPPLPPIVLPEGLAEGTDEGAPPSPVRHMLPDALVTND
jgi:phage replication-related protein YjqB (UPF0714/DUF867 family)